MEKTGAWPVLWKQLLQCGDGYQSAMLLCTKMPRELRRAGGV